MNNMFVIYKFYLFSEEFEVILCDIFICQIKSILLYKWI